MAIRKVGDDPEKILRVTCHDCGSILEYLRCDVKHECRMDYSGTSDDYYWIDCPQCRKRVYVKNH